MDNILVKPHGGELVDLLVNNERATEIIKESRHWLSWDMSQRQSNDIELLINGGFSPLKGFMNKKEYDSVCEKMRLPDGTIWPIPIVLDVTEEFAETLSKGKKITLRDVEGVMIAVLTVEDIWAPDKRKEAETVYGTTDESHSGVEYLYNEANLVYIGGSIEALQYPMHYDFPALRRDPKNLREEFARKG